MTIKILYLVLYFLSNDLMTTTIFGKKPEVALIPVGKFNISESTKLIYLDDCYIDKTELTQKKFKKIMAFIIFFKSEYHLADQIKWCKAKEYCEKTE